MDFRDLVYKKYAECPPRLRHQAIWRFGIEAAEEMRRDPEIGKTGFYPGALLLGRKVTISRDVEGFYLDGRPERPRNGTPKRRGK